MVSHQKLTCSHIARRCYVALVFLALNLAGLANLSGQVDTDTPKSLSGYGPSQVYEIEDGGSLDLEYPFLRGLLYRVGQVSKQNVHEYAQYSRQVKLTDVAEYPRKHRLWMFDLVGRVNLVNRKSFANVDIDDVVKACFVTDMTTDDGTEIKIVSRSIPRAWVPGTSLNHRARFQGFFLQHVTDQGTSKPVFVCNRIAWHPDQLDADMEIGPSQIVLAKKGVDIGLFDFVRQKNTQSLSRVDSECFYQILQATKNISIAEIDPLKPVGFLELMQNPKKQFGNTVSIAARCRRCVPIVVSDPDVRERIGIDQYYELDMFVRIEGKVVIKNTDGTSLEYETRFPLTVCVARLPNNLTPAEVSNRQVNISGFFYRFWRYKSEFTDQSEGQGGQVSPLIIGLTPEVIEVSAQGMDYVLYFVLIGSLSFFLGLMIWFKISDRKFQPATQAQNKSLPDKVDFSDVVDNLED